MIPFHSQAWEMLGPGKCPKPTVPIMVTSAAETLTTADATLAGMAALMVVDTTSALRIPSCPEERGRGRPRHTS
jgi:hypothetical protein